MSDAQSINVDDFRTAANEMRKAYGHHNAVCTSTDLLLRALAKIESDAKVIAAWREALREISQPLITMQDRAKAEGCDFNGETALNIISNPEHYRAIARRALAANEQTAGESK